MQLQFPLDDCFQQIYPALIECKYKKTFDQERGIEFWYNKKTRYKQPLDKKLFNAFSSYLLDAEMIHTLDDNKNYPTSFIWLYFRKTWKEATMSIFVDLNNGFLLLIKRLYNNGNGFGLVVSKKTFLNKYRI